MFGRIRTIVSRAEHRDRAPARTKRRAMGRRIDAAGAARDDRHAARGERCGKARGLFEPVRRRATRSHDREARLVEPPLCRASTRTPRRVVTPRRHLAMLGFPAGPEFASHPQDRRRIGDHREERRIVRIRQVAGHRESNPRRAASIEFPPGRIGEGLFRRLLPSRRGVETRSDRRRDRIARRVERVGGRSEPFDQATATGGADPLGQEPRDAGETLVRGEILRERSRSPVDRRAEGVRHAREPTWRTRDARGFLPKRRAGRRFDRAAFA